MNEFSVSFNEVDQLILTDIYAASEEPIPEVNSKKLYNLVKQNNKNNSDFNVQYIQNFNDILKFLKKELKPDDILLTVGAGNIYEIGEKLVGE
jgi:UDP-N-acetylmuramate--alanine ligase